MNTSLVSVIAVISGPKKTNRLNARCLAGVLDQTYRNLQVILVYSEQDNDFIQKNLSVEDARLEVHPYPGTGSGADLWNYGYTFVKGRYIALYRYGDIWRPEKLEKQLECLESDRDISACFTWTNETDSRLRNRTCESWISAVYNDAYRPDPYTVLERTADIGRNAMFDPVYQQGFLLEWYLRLLEGRTIHVLEEEMSETPADEKAWDLAHEPLTARVQLYNESSHIFSRWIDTMDVELFLGSFYERLRNRDSASVKEAECEKAFLLLKLPGSSTLSEQGMVRLGNLLREEESRKLLKRKYRFTQLDYYEMMKTHIYFDPVLQQPLLSGYKKAAEAAAAAEADEAAACVYEKETARLRAELEADRKNRVVEEKRREIERLTREIEREHRKYGVLKKLLHSVKQLSARRKA